MFDHHSLIPWGSFRGRQEEKWGSFRGRFRDHFRVGDLYSPRNDPDPEMIPNPEMIPKSTPK